MRRFELAIAAGAAIMGLQQAEAAQPSRNAQAPALDAGLHLARGGDGARTGSLPLPA